MRIESDSSSIEYEEEEEQIGISNCDAEDSDEVEQMIPEVMLPVYGMITMSGIIMRNQRVMFAVLGETLLICLLFFIHSINPPKTMLISKNFCRWPKIMLANLPLRQQKSLTIPLRMSMTVVRLSRRRMAFMLLYALRHVTRRKTYHTTDFSCLDEDMLKELKGIKNEILYDRRTTLLNNKLHLIKDILTRYGYLLSRKKLGI